MAVGKQSEATIVHWHPGESRGKDGSGVTSVSLPEDIIPSGVLLILSEDFATESYVDAAISDLASGFQDVANDSVAVLRAELVASGYLH